MDIPGMEASVMAASLHSIGHAGVSVGEIAEAFKNAAETMDEASKAFGLNGLAGSVEKCQDLDIVGDDDELPQVAMLPADYGLDDAAVEAIMKHADAVAAAHQKPSKPRRSLAMEWKLLGRRLVAPEMPADSANFAYAKRAEKLIKAAIDGGPEAVKAIEINGVNTYGKALRSFQDGILDALESAGVK